MNDEIINVFIYEGSLNYNSKSELINEKLLATIKQNLNIKVEKFSLRKYNIEICKGCQKCFSNGYCSLDDDMEQMKTSLLNADLVIFLVPVYLKQVSSAMKIFLDRIAYWTHLMKLIGKKGIVIVTGSTNGINETSKYMLEICRYLGLCNIDLIAYNETTDGELNNIFGIVDMIANKTVKHFKDNDCLIVSKESERIFQAYRNLYSKLKEDGIETYEVRYWDKTGMLNCNTLQEYFEIKKLLKHHN